MQQGLPRTKINMEIIENIRTKSEVDSFLKMNFITFSNEDNNPITPHQVNYKTKGNDIAFCNRKVVDAWGFKQDSSYAFFLVLKKDALLFEEIMKRYGHPDVASEVEFEVNDQAKSSRFKGWHTNDTNIYLRELLRFERMARYKGCILLIIGNMDYEDTFRFSTKKGF